MSCGMSGVSLCMIVKNEEDWIEGALKCVKDLVDEVIIVDTGSTDATLAKIRQFYPKVIPFKWIDDFAAARNASLEAATQPWILVLDADERIAARDIPVLQAATQRKEDGFHLIQRNYVSANNIIGWSPNTRGSRARAFWCSMTTTRGSLRRRGSSWPVPTSTA